jgi:hypothetical protein
MVFASWNGVRLVNEQVNVFYPPREERISHFRPGKDFLRISLLNAVLCFLALLYGWPMTIGRKVFALIRTIYSLLFFVINSMFVMTPIVYIYLSIGRITEKKKYNLHRMIRYMADFVLSRHGIPGIRYTQTNHCNEDFSKPSVIICNHSRILTLYLCLLFRRRSSYLQLTGYGIIRCINMPSVMQSSCRHHQVWRIYCRSSSLW